MSLLGMDVHHHRVVDVFYLVESLHQPGHVVALLYIEIVEAEGAEVVEFSLSVALAQELEVAI